MISKSPIASAGAATYYTSQQRAAEYYSGEAVPSQWRGKAAEVMGLAGRVDENDLTRLLAGHVTDATGQRTLGRMVDGQREHRAGLDLTISAPKSVSIEALVHGRDDALEAHRAAVQTTLDYFETHAAQARISGRTVQTGNLAIATFEHVSSRSKDPQLHTHALVANATIDARTGRAYSLSNERLLTHRRSADAVYHATLSRELQKRGYAVTHDREGRVEIAGYSREQLEDFSKRTAQIKEALAARGKTVDSASPEMKAMAKLDTRATKDLPEIREAHIERWQAQAKLLGVQPAEVSRVGTAAEPDAAREAVEQAKRHLTEREFTFSTKDLHQQAARFSAGKTDWKQIEAEIAQQIKSGALGHAADGVTNKNGATLTTREALAAESKMAAALGRGTGEHLAVMNREEFDQALARFEKRKGFALSDEQRAAARMILTGDDRFQGVQGLAGTGKTTMLKFAREAAEAKGWTVIGHSNGSEQAATMERESGIASTTTAGHLIEQDRVFGDPSRLGTGEPIRELRIMDEAGQAGQREFNDVIRTTEASGARTVFLGDRLQHQSVESGKAFERAQSHMPIAKLGAASIRRQTTDRMKSAVADVLDKRHADALKRLEVREVREAQAKLKPEATRDQRRDAAKADNASVIARLAKDYAAMPAADRENVLIVTATNADRQSINNAIRHELKTKGELEKGVTVTTLHKTDLTKIEAGRAENYEPGQIVQTGGKNSVRGEILRADQRSNTLTIRTDAGQEKIIDLARSRVQTYTPETREFSAGDRIRITENHALSRLGTADQMKVRNGQIAHVEHADAYRITLRFGDGDKAQRIDVDPRQALKAEHAYVSTSHAAQGQTVNKVLIHHNTEAGRHGDRETYVNITRARRDAVIYTQNAEKAGRQAGAELNKSAAHDVLPRVPEHQKSRDFDRGQDFGL